MAKIWRTCDLKAVAFLVYKGFEILNFSKRGTRVFFEFEDTKERQHAILSLLNRGVTVEPLMFLEKLSQARDMVSLSQRT